MPKTLSSSIHLAPVSYTHLDVYKRQVFIRSGGSIPIVGDFARNLGLPSVMMGFGLPDDNLHAPNEKFNLQNFALGIESLIEFLEEAGR